MKRQDDGVDVHGKQPGFWFYPADFERDVAPFPLSTQALWARMLCRMHWAARRGYLEHPSGSPITPEQLGRMVGETVENTLGMLTEMEHSGLFSRDENGVIFNRRMARDSAISEVRRNAALKKNHKDRGTGGKFAPANAPSGLRANAPAKSPSDGEQKTESSSSSSSSSSPKGIKSENAPSETETDVVIRSQPEYIRDETFTPFKVAFENTGAALIESDWIEAHYEWRVLDFEQKAGALVGVKRLMGKDPNFIPKPKNYLKRREWTREQARRTQTETVLPFWEPPTQ